MKPIIFLFSAFALALSATAQNKEKITLYFDSNWMPTGDQSIAKYYRTVEEGGRSKFIVRDYFISGKLQMVAACSSISPAIRYEGKRTNYYENGNVESERYYVDNEVAGDYKTYYEDGKLKRETRYRAKKEIIIHSYSPTGQDELSPEGNGILKVKSTDEFNQFEDVQDSVSLSTYNVHVSTGDTIYLRIERPAEFKGGLSALGRFVSSTLRYPASARRMGVEGSVFVSFIVDKNGAVTNAKVIKGISPDCDAEAQRTVAAMPNWIPGQTRGKAVKSMFVQPIKYKLAGGRKKKR
ncbi:energy transducer TonB [Chryseolinea soli]|uniref:TonB family protein n=1 Tax=Chryseolinea soli TaxID=2321403 RepID=A0A385SRJ0_9BACT|nr:energy transducer TonB [Chryseolinea soli]AYB33779.1 TonB family protein [Chryseolinea soli]